MAYIPKQIVARPNEFIYGKVNLDDSRTGSEERFSPQMSYLPGMRVFFESQDQSEEIVLCKKYNELTPEEKMYYMSKISVDIGKEHFIIVTKKDEKIQVRIMDDVRYNTGVHPDVGLHF